MTKQYIPRRTGSWMVQSDWDPNVNPSREGGSTESNPSLNAKGYKAASRGRWVVAAEKFPSRWPLGSVCPLAPFAPWLRLPLGSAEDTGAIS